MGREERANHLLINSQPAIVRDFLGRELGQGDEVLLVVDQPLVFRVLQITPATGPDMPPGLLHVDVITRQRFVAARGQALKYLVRVNEARHAQPMTQASAAAVEATAPEADTPVEES